MSGGHFDSLPYHLSAAIDIIERYQLRDFKYMGEDYSTVNWDEPKDWPENRFEREYDRLEGATLKQREQIIARVKELHESLQKSYWLLHELDYLLSGDTGPDSFLERVDELEKENYSRK